MSLWSDIQKRSAGEAIRKEVENNINDILNNILTNRINVVETLPPNPSIGEIYLINDENRVVTYANNNWITIGYVLENMISNLSDNNNNCIIDTYYHQNY